MCHDQAQIATKMPGFERKVLIGAGYPSALATPSHGTASDIAGKAWPIRGRGQAVGKPQRLGSASP